MLQKNQLFGCYKRIQPYIHNTPVLTSEYLNEISGASIFFKCENFQKTGSFKMRGATSAILHLSEEQMAKGVVTHSSGNFAQAIALAAKSIGVTAYIVMPFNSPKVKKDAVSGYEGRIMECEPTLLARESTAKKIQFEMGATFIHPSNDIHVILGQGTASMELLEKHQDLDVIFTPVGGGGLIAGTGLAANYFAKNCKVIGVEPLEADDAYRSLQSGRIESNTSTNTIAEGLKTQLGDKNFPIILHFVDHITRVSEEETIDSMRLIWERMKIIVEPSSAVALAGVLKEKDIFRNKKIGVIISGGNVDLNKLPFESYHENN
jgi:threonine dehydratase